MLDSLNVTAHISSYDHETTLFLFRKKDDSVDLPDSQYLDKVVYVLKDGKYVIVPPSIDVDQVDQDELTVLGEDAYHRYYLYRGRAYAMDLSKPGIANTPQGTIPSSFTDGGNMPGANSTASYAGYEPTAASPTPATGNAYVPSASDAKASAKSAAEDATPATGDPTSLAGAIAAAMTSAAAFVAAKSTRRR